MSQSNNSDGQQGPSTDSSALTRSQLAQALQDLARGEQTANALENNLSKLESKLDELLASFEETTEEIMGQKRDAGFAAPARTEQDSAAPSTSPGKATDDRDDRDDREKRTD